MFRAMLWGLGRRFDIKRHGRWHSTYGWSEAEWVEFPPPVGRRRLYLVLEMSDLDVLPELFAVSSVEFKAGSEYAWVNRVLARLGWLRARTGHPRWERYTQAMRALSWLVGRLGHDRGAAMFEITGRAEGRPRVFRYAVVTDRDGGRIPVAPAGMAIERMLDQRLPPGIQPLDTWIPPHEFLAGLRDRGFKVWASPPAGEPPEAPRRTER